MKNPCKEISLGIHDLHDSKMSDPGDYYEKKEEEVQRILAQIEKVKKEEPKNFILLRLLEKHLELARYVGD